MSKDNGEVNGVSGADANYEVGRGKPPVATQFAKGRSGNPSGKPKGTRNKVPHLNEERLKQIVLEEAYRDIELTEGGREVKMPMAQAIIRKVVVQAVKGEPRAQAMFTRMLAAVEQERKTRHDHLFGVAMDYKIKWEKELQRRHDAGLAGPTPQADFFVLTMKKGSYRELTTEEIIALEALENRAREEGRDLVELLMEEREKLVGDSR